ncbi:DNA-processing protein DprA [Halovenus rubra]|uniref:DNA-processing protein DprA n=2 Tax=Halovenus rubra TaxID=869890 RepID=A0ABD5XDP4_9EURY|nr:DNA-processing protein DprA [Halovenus rubra]
MNDDDLATLLALTELQGIGDARALELFRAFETGAELQTSPQEAFEKFHYVDTDTCEKLQQLEPTVDEYRQQFRQYRSEGIEVIGIDDDRYPQTLRTYHAPLVLYAKGNLDRLGCQTVSVSGSRRINEVGQKWIRNIAREMAGEGYTIVSGGARGTDTAAHEGALDVNGATIVVLGTGVNVPYPEENADLFSNIVDADGLLLSHRPPEAEPARYAFPERNQTLSALSPGIVIVATDGSGGTTAQYEIALDQERRVFVPEASLDIQPNEGLKELRSSESTTVVSSAAAIEAEITESPPHDHRESASEEDSTNGDNQTSLDKWNN